MSRTSWAGWLLAGVLLAPAPLFGQSIEHRDSDTLRGPPGAAEAEQRFTPDLDRVKEQIAVQTNAFRKAEGRGPLRPDAALSKAAQGFAEYLARTDKFSHTADGRQPSQRVAEQGYEFCLVAENIAYEFNSEGFRTEDLARAFVRGWEHSPEHRRNMLDGDLTDIGVGVARSRATGRYYAVQDFGRPKSMAVSFEVSNQSGETVRYEVAGREFTLPPRYTRAHELCRPAKVEFEPPGGEPVVFRVRNGARYVARPRGDSGYTVGRE